MTLFDVVVVFKYEMKRTKRRISKKETKKKERALEIEKKNVQFYLVRGILCVFSVLDCDFDCNFGINVVGILLFTNNKTLAAEMYFLSI